jgi:DNA polymerase-3 subunit gamma/tau
LVRIAYAADLPTPDEAIRSLNEASRGNGAVAASDPSAKNPPAAAPRSESRSEVPRGGARGPQTTVAPASSVQQAIAPDVAPDSETGEPVRALHSFADLIALAAEKRDLGVKSALERDVRLVRFEDGTLELALEPSARHTLVGELSKKLGLWTGRRWMVAVSAEASQPSVHAQSEMRKSALKDGVRDDPLVQAVLARFPGAEIVAVRPPGGVPAADEMPELPPVDSDLPEER